MGRALIVSAGASSNEYISARLAELGYTRPTIIPSGAEARRRMLESDFELIVVNAPLPDEFGHELCSSAVEKTDAGVVLLAKAAAAEQLLAPCEGERTEAGMRANIRVAVQYIEAWISGNGCVPIYGLMEDAATAEISRTSIWQWIHHQKTLNDGTPVTKALFRQWLAEELMVIQEELGEHRFSHGRFDDAARLMEQITTSDELIDFLTLPGYRLLA